MQIKLIVDNVEFNSFQTKKGLRRDLIASCRDYDRTLSHFVEVVVPEDTVTDDVLNVTVKEIRMPIAGHIRISGVVQVVKAAAKGK